jgi:hypothetical protein
MSYYTNSDGLNIRFGSDRATSSKMGRVSTAGDLQEVVVSFDYSDIGTADDVVGTHPQMGIPNGAYIESATLYVTTAFVGATATLDIGIWNDDGDGTFSTNDDDGIDAAIGVATLVADARIACNGAKINTTIAGTGGRSVYVSTGYNTAAFTAGAADLVIKYRR